MNALTFVIYFSYKECFIKTSPISSTYISEYTLQITKLQKTKTRISRDKCQVVVPSVASYKLEVTTVTLPGDSGVIYYREL
jgi:hypothetical protein